MLLDLTKTIPEEMLDLYQATARDLMSNPILVAQLLNFAKIHAPEFYDELLAIIKRLRMP